MPQESSCGTQLLIDLLSGLPLGLGFLWILIDDNRQGWHDKITRTYVIYTWAARPDELHQVIHHSTEGSQTG